MTLETGRLAKLADGACLVQFGETVVLCVELDRLLRNRQAQLKELVENKDAALVEFNRVHVDLLERARSLIAGETGGMEDRLAAAALLARHPGPREVAMEFLRRRISPATPPGELKAVLAVLGGTHRQWLGGG